MAEALQGRAAVVTGASSGIGEATALALAAAGADVALVARRADRLEALAPRVEEHGVKALAIECDVSDEAQANAAVQQAHSELGRLDVLVNNAGVMLLGPVAGADTEEWRRMIDVNILGLLYCTHAVLPLMTEAGGGHIVNVSSTAGRHANLGAAVYNFTKFGVCGFSEALRQEALHSKIRVTIIEPGMVETELLDHNTNPIVQAGAKHMREQLGKPLDAEDIANAIVYATSQPEHVAINEMLVRPTGQQR